MAIKIGSDLQKGITSAAIDGGSRNVRY